MCKYIVFVNKPIFFLYSLGQFANRSYDSRMAIMCFCCSRQFVENAISNSLDAVNCTNSKG